MGRTPYTGFFGRLSAEDRRIILSSMEAVGASKLANRIFMSLSDGEKQKVLIARALAQEPELILMDEPTSHLDIKHKIEVVHILNRLCRERNMVVVLALHDIDLALKACQNVMMIKNGAVQGCGSPEDIVGSDTKMCIRDSPPAFHLTKSSLLSRIEKLLMPEQNTPI